MKKGIIIEIVCYAIILLFLYASLSKLFSYNLYVYDLNRSPLLKPYTTILSIIVPVAELAISGLLFFPKTRIWGLYSSAVLMTIFTFYVWFIVAIVQRTPCTCGGLIRNLTWKQHLIFNIFYTSISIIGAWLETKKRREDGFDHRNISFS